MLGDFFVELFLHYHRETGIMGDKKKRNIYFLFDLAAAQKKQKLRSVQSVLEDVSASKTV